MENTNAATSDQIAEEINSLEEAACCEISQLDRLFDDFAKPLSPFAEVWFRRETKLKLEARFEDIDRIGGEEGKALKEDVDDLLRTLPEIYLGRSLRRALEKVTQGTTP